MNIEDKIRKRIRTMETATNKQVEEIQITKEEAEKLGDRKNLDGVKLIVVDKLGEKTKKDCYAYLDKNGHGECYCLEKLYCKIENCNFYKTGINRSDIEHSIREYAKNH